MTQEKKLQDAKEFLIEFLAVDTEEILCDDEDIKNKLLINNEIEVRQKDMEIALEYILEGENTNKDDRFFDQYYQMDTLQAFNDDVKTIQIIKKNLYYQYLLTI